MIVVSMPYLLVIPTKSASFDFIHAPPQERDLLSPAPSTAQYGYGKKTMPIPTTMSLHLPLRVTRAQ